VPLKPDPAQQRPLQRVVAVGASVTAGYGNGLPLGRALDVAILGAHKPVNTVPGGTTFFLNPRKNGRHLMDLAKKRKPSLLLALDFLFWYAYGPKSAWQRSADLALGFKQLERYPGPIVVGDLPDMHGADPLMLPMRFIPSVKQLASLNSAIKRWAAGRKQVLLLSLAQWFPKMKQEGLALPASKGQKALLISPKQLLQWDRLHPTRLGVQVLVDQIVKALKAWLPEQARKHLSFNLRQHLQQTLKARQKPKPAKNPAGHL